MVDGQIKLQSIVQSLCRQFLTYRSITAKWVPCNHGMASPRVVDTGRGIATDNWIKSRPTWRLGMT